MTHIMEVDESVIVQANDDFCALILKPAKTVSVGDKIIFEHNTEQVERTVLSVSDRPGLMKGYGLYIFNQLN